MPMDFPSSPTIGQQYNGYVWDGVAWDSTSAQPISLSTTAPGYNAIINGAFDIWQRGTSFTVGTGYPYTADRWQVIRAGAVAGMTVTRQSASLTGLQYALRCQRDSGNTNTAALTAWQTIESVNSIPFAGQSATLSFYARAGANFSGTGLTASIASGTGTDQNLNIGGFTGYTVVATSTATLTTSWQRFTVSGTFGSSITQAGLLFQTVGITGTAGANDWFEITGVQLEEGSAATDFRRNAPSIQGELAACQRYYFRKVADANYTNFGIGRADATNSAICMIPFPVPMRALPATVNETSAASTFMLEGLGGAVPGTSVAGPIGVRNSTTSGSLYLGTAGSLTTQTLYLLTSNVNSTAYVAFSAEL